MSVNTLITEKVEQAIVAFVAGSVIGDIAAANVFAGLSSGTNADDVTSKQSSNPLPNVIVTCEDADHQAPFSGNWLAHPTIEISSNADTTTKDDHMTRAAAVLNLFATDTIKTDLSAALADFTAHIVILKNQSHTRTGRMWKSRITLEIECCGSDIS